jgi:hypothetical protein
LLVLPWLETCIPSSLPVVFWWQAMHAASLTVPLAGLMPPVSVSPLIESFRRFCALKYAPSKWVLSALPGV